MSVQQEMRSLTQEIVRSYQERVTGIASLRQEVGIQREATRTQVHEIDRARNAMARQQRAELGRGRTHLASNVAGQLRELDTRRQAMARQQRAELGGGRTHLASSVAGQLRELDTRQQAMAQQQRAELGRGRAHLSSSIGGQLRELGAAHQAMGQQQRAELGRGRAGLEASVSLQILGYHEELAGARAAWEGMTATLGARRGGHAAVAGAPAAPVAAAPVAAPPAVAGTPAPASLVVEVPVAVEEEEEAVARAEVGEVTPEFISVRDRVFEYVANHPDGTRLVEIERELGLSRLAAARVVRNLMDEGKVEKRGLLYFAI